MPFSWAAGLGVVHWLAAVVGNRYDVLPLYLYEGDVSFAAVGRCEVAEEAERPALTGSSSSGSRFSTDQRASLTEWQP
jgi:hypothetical protein